MKKNNPFKIFRKNKVKVSVSRELVKRLIEESNNIISKKDLGYVFDMVLVNPERLIDNEIKDYIEHKYNLERIISYLKKTNKKVISFRRLMNKLRLSKRKFYPRLGIIKNFYAKSKNFRWYIKRGKFIKKEAL